MDQVGPKPVVTLMKKMGIKSYLPEVPSIALGTPDISLYEMVGAYSTFVNKGIYIEPIFITRIEDKNGVPLYEVIPQTTDVLSAKAWGLNRRHAVPWHGGPGHASACLPFHATQCMPRRAIPCHSMNIYANRSRPSWQGR